LHPPSIVEDDLRTWPFYRKQIQAGFASYKTNPTLWKNQSAASSSSLNPPEEYHFVMTNFCLWITSDSWLDIGAYLRADLLENNPSFKGSHTRSPGVTSEKVLS
jgi:hypothetical protein